MYRMGLNIKVTGRMARNPSLFSQVASYTSLPMPAAAIGSILGTAANTCRALPTLFNVAPFVTSMHLYEKTHKCNICLSV